jgi:hypothetical protein
MGVIMYFNGKKYKEINNDFAQGSILDVTDEATYKPQLIWKRKLPVAVWNQILSYMAESQRKFGAETQMRLLWHDDHGWKAHAFPQETGGMTTKELDNDEKEEQMKLFPDYIPLGTVHHHCNISAFQSGTDEKDEVDQEGIHITLGNLDDTMFDCHVRICLEEAFHETTIDMVVDLDEPRIAVRDAMLLSDPKAPFPMQWIKNVTKEKPRVFGSTYPAYPTQKIGMGGGTGSYISYYTLMEELEDDPGYVFIAGQAENREELDRELRAYLADGYESDITDIAFDLQSSKGAIMTQLVEEMCDIAYDKEGKPMTPEIVHAN